MKTSALLLALASLTASQAFAQNIGDAVTPEALSQVEWVKGSAPSTWEPGKLYILECWATWCGPCVAAIPHVDALYDKYHEKGLNVLGMNCFEDGIDKVKAFVTKKGDGMSYPVSYTGKGGAFETAWLKPAGVNSIPQAFLVKDGKVLLKMHPAQITEELIEAILAGGDKQEQAVAPLAEKQKVEVQASKAQAEFREAAEKKDLTAMARCVETLEKSDPESKALGSMRVKLFIAQEKWDEAAAAVRSLPDAPARTALVNEISGPLLKQDGVPPSFFKALAENFGAVPAGNNGMLLLIFQSRVYWKADEKDQAIATNRKAMELAGAADAGPVGAMLKSPLEKSAAAFNEGRMPTDEEFSGWIKESSAAMKKP